MDVRDGTIYPAFSDVDPIDRPFLKEMTIPPTARQREAGKIHRNDNCPCGSGKKFKKCCMLRVTVKVDGDVSLG